MATVPPVRITLPTVVVVGHRDRRQQTGTDVAAGPSGDCLRIPAPGVTRRMIR
jgi:hypothetical protein